MLFILFTPFVLKISVSWLINGDNKNVITLSSFCENERYVSEI